jgi:hypothetical protein
VISADYPNRSVATLNDFQELLLQRRCAELNLEGFRNPIRTIDTGVYWLSGLRLCGLPQYFPNGHRTLLTRSLDRVRQLRKPAVAAMSRSAAAKRWGING